MTPKFPQNSKKTGHKIRQQNHSIRRRARIESPNAIALSSDSLRLITFALAALLFVSCSTASSFISEQQARDIALKSSDAGHLRMIESPSRVRAELLTLETARKRLASSGKVGNQRAPDMMVWLVTMEGIWIISGGPPTPQGATQTPQETFHHYAIILNAKTGELISQQATH